eukprot:1136281-Pelagomonas_calceolata.AAC.1
MAVQDPNGTDAFDPDTTPQKVSPACAIRYNIGNSPSCLEGGLELPTSRRDQLACTSTLLKALLLIPLHS